VKADLKKKGSKASHLNEIAKRGGSSPSWASFFHNYNHVSTEKSTKVMSNFGWKLFINFYSEKNIVHNKARPKGKQDEKIIEISW